MEQRAHWNNIGSSYQDEIFDVFKSDRNQLLPKIFKTYSNPQHTAIDFGCGVGRAFEYLSPSFKSVLALDISDNLLDIARKTPYKNITIKHHDLTKPLKAKADFGLRFLLQRGDASGSRNEPHHASQHSQVYQARRNRSDGASVDGFIFLLCVAPYRMV
jgi:SAM-dependent methyltransferase